MIKLHIIVPCRNVEASIQATAVKLQEKLTELKATNDISAYSRIVFVDDGSTDRTWDLISDIHSSNRIFSAVKLTKPQGRQYAILAGLQSISEFTDVAISYDPKLLDDFNIIDRFLKEYQTGYDIVYGVRTEKVTDNTIQKLCSNGITKFQSAMGVNSIPNHEDLLLLSNRAIVALQDFTEANMFLSGTLDLTGFKSTRVFYESPTSVIESKEGIHVVSRGLHDLVSLSAKPLSILTWIGAIFSFAALIILIIVLCNAKGAPDGWTTIMISIWFLGGLQLFGIGMIGTYLSRNYIESKRRPKFVIEEFLNL